MAVSHTDTRGVTGNGAQNGGMAAGMMVTSTHYGMRSPNLEKEKEKARHKAT